VAFASEATNLVPGDTNAATDIFVHDRETGRTVRVSVPSRGGQINGDSWTPSISGDGRYVAFPTDADNVTPGDNNGALAASPGNERASASSITHSARSIARTRPSGITLPG
jgi:Tol biopolymer transport system component